MVIHIKHSLAAQTKFAHTTRNVPLNRMNKVGGLNLRPRAGDLVLARVVELGQHAKLEGRGSRKAQLFVGDEIVLAYGARYAPDQFEAEVPTDLGPCELVAAGGIAGRVVSMHRAMEPATKLEPIGLLVDENGAPLNLRDFALTAMPSERVAPTIAVVGGSMNAGKTTTCAYLVHGLAKAGLRVGAAKITGTGAGNDTGLMRDAGAAVVLDFTDAGFATTYQASPADLEYAARTLTSALVAAEVDVIVLEIADGVYQAETGWLVQAPFMRQLVGGWVYAAESAASADAGAAWLRRAVGDVLAISGRVTASPLAMREAEAAIGERLHTIDELADPVVARSLFDALPKRGVTSAAFAA